MERSHRVDLLVHNLPNAQPPAVKPPILLFGDTFIVHVSWGVVARQLRLSKGHEELKPQPDTTCGLPCSPPARQDDMPFQGLTKP